ncbi:MAG TPA: helix-hairpin-helix domain-containing protein [Nannocystaceae bacterium]|nr:helix-hairpin-helix domain-containing protein [Nannocystaceae bacterium]
MRNTLRSLFCGSLVAAALFFSTSALAMAPQLEGQVNINTATQEQLELLPGIGPAIAQKVMDYRAQKPFEDPVHLMRIKGIGRKTYAKMKPFLSTKGENTLHVVGDTSEMKAE